jgi:hypothetical protein
MCCSCVLKAEKLRSCASISIPCEQPRRWARRFLVSNREIGGDGQAKSAQIHMYCIANSFSSAEFLGSSAMLPFSHPAHRTGLPDLPEVWRYWSKRRRKGLTWSWQSELVLEPLIIVHHDATQPVVRTVGMKDIPRSFSRGNSRQPMPLAPGTQLGPYELCTRGL